MLKRRGVTDVSHLSGGIHRYVEKYGSDGFYTGKVFVFDRRVALDPDSMVVSKGEEEGPKEKDAKGIGNKIVVGKCIECHRPEDRISGANLCTVCRDLVLICQKCKNSIHEFHCERHRPWKRAYFTFLERFASDELHDQLGMLQKMHDTTYAKGHRNVRRTLRKQMEKVRSRMEDLEGGTAVVERNARRRCRTCFESEDICDGLCWGFWRSMQSPHGRTKNGNKDPEPILAVEVGDRVIPGPNWNELRHGSRRHSDTEYQSRKKMRSDAGAETDEQSLCTSQKIENTKMGTVVEIKPWAAGGTEMDCVAVSWDLDQTATQQCNKRCRGKARGVKESSEDGVATVRSEIYRWGAVARNGKRMYDLKLVS